MIEYNNIIVNLFKRVGYQTLNFHVFNKTGKFNKILFLIQPFHTQILFSETQNMG